LDQKINMKIYISLIVLSFNLVGCRNFSQNSFQDNIYENIKRRCPNGGCEIKISEFTGFEWEKMYVFTAQASSEEMSKQMGIKYDGWIDMKGQIVFTRNDSVIFTEYQDYDPEKPNKIIFGDKDDPSHSLKITPNAIFKVNKVPVSEDCFELIQK
jgi:hypothetical protein